MARRGSGEGSIYRRASDGRWVGAISIGAGERKVLYGETRLAVAEKMKALLREQQRGIRLHSADRLTLGAFLEEWIAGARANVRASTWIRYKQLVHVHLVPRLGAIALTKLAPTDLTKMYARMQADGLAPRTAGHTHRVLGRALRDAEIAGHVARNVCRLVRPPRVPRAEMRTLTREQVRALLAATELDRDGPLWHVAMASGARLGELLALTWDRVDLERGAIRITRSLTLAGEGDRYEIGEPKTSASRRTVPIGRAAAAALRRHRAAQELEHRVAGAAWHGGELVFSDEIGRQLRPQRISRALASRLAATGLPRVRFHDLRHTCATLLLEAGVNPRVVAERLGHTTPALVLNVYGHVTERMQEQATAVIDQVLA